MKKVILVTGGEGRFAKVLKKNNKILKLYFTTKEECNILNINRYKSKTSENFTKEILILLK